MGFGLKTRLLRLAGDLGYEVRRVDRRADRVPGGDAPLVQMTIGAMLARGRGVRVVQIGANDGVTEDPLSSSLSNDGVEAILVEPLPGLCDQLRDRYEGQARIRVVQVAISDSDEPAKIYVAVRDEDGEIADSRISSFDRESVENHVRWRRDVEAHLFGASPRVESIEVPCRTVAQVVRDVGWDRADILLIDAEGHDLVIVESVLASDVDFDAIICEYGNLQMTEFERLTAGLVQADYRLAKTGKDLMAVKSNALD